MSPTGDLKTSENFGKFLRVRLRCSLFLAQAFTCKLPNSKTAGFQNIFE